MRAPGYMKLEKITPVPGKFEVPVRMWFCPWHLDTLRDLWRIVHVRPRVLKPAVILIGWLRMCLAVRA